MQRWSATGAKNPDEPIIEPVGKTFDTDASAICTSLCSFDEEPVRWRSKDTYLASYLNKNLFSEFRPTDQQCVIQIL